MPTTPTSSASRKAGSTPCPPSSWASCSPWRRSKITFGEWGGPSASNEKRIAMVERYGIDILAVRDRVAEDLDKQQRGSEEHAEAEEATA
jgi:hypothetical protein